MRFRCDVVSKYFKLKCKHIINAQVAIRPPCCKRWFDCSECHFEVYEDDHELEKSMEFVFACKKCKKTFRKDVTEYEDADEYCPHCDNLYVIEVKTTQTEGKMIIEFQTQKGHEKKVFKDEREK